jgi:hypothetical protein
MSDARGCWPPGQAPYIEFTPELGPSAGWGLPGRASPTPSACRPFSSRVAGIVVRPAVHQRRLRRHRRRADRSPAGHRLAADRYDGRTPAATTCAPARSPGSLRTKRSQPRHRAPTRVLAIPGLVVDFNEPVPLGRWRAAASPALRRPQVRVPDLMNDPHQQFIVVLNFSETYACVRGPLLPPEPEIASPT